MAVELLIALARALRALPGGGGRPLRSVTRDRAPRYLEHLAVEGIVTLSMRYGGTGRPEHLYAWPA